MQFGLQLRAARESRGYTQKDLAKLVGVTPTSVARAERGEQAVRWNVLERIIEQLGQSPAFYFSSEAPKVVRPKPTLAEALAVIREELGIELSPVKRPPQKESPGVDREIIEAIQRLNPSQRRGLRSYLQLDGSKELGDEPHHPTTKKPDPFKP